MTSLRCLPSLGLIAGLLLLGGCANFMPRGGRPQVVVVKDTPSEPAYVASAATRAQAAAAVAAAQAAASGLRPFDDVVKGAKRSDGLFTMWQKDDRVWMELRPDDLNRPFFLSPKLKTGIGEGRFYGGLMGDEVVVEFRRVHNQVQLIARNTQFVAKAGGPAGQAVQAAFSPSLLAAAPVLSQPQKERHSVLVEANTLFVNDMLGTGMQLQRAFRQGYSMDLRNSAITTVRATPELLVLEVMGHFATGSISPPSPGGPSVPRSLPDPRSMFLTLHYSLARLPDEPMQPRKADARVGYFTSNVADFSDDTSRTPRQRFVNRWRLEKKDPDAPLSEPVKPITFWLDKTIPEKYRAPIMAGVLEWNKAFERIGFKEAIRVEVQPADAGWDTLDFGRASIRWMTDASPAFAAIGPSHVDPRSGEILDADIGLESFSSRNMRAVRAQVMGVSTLGVESAAPQVNLKGARSAAFCEFGDLAAEQLGYGLDVMEARGDVDPNGAEAEQFIAAYLKDTTMHEVGHALGLRHNFRSSRVYSDLQLSDPEFTRTHSLTGSVMDYAPINLAAPGVPRDKQPAPFSSTLGPYDYWAIEYAYRPLPADQEDAELKKIASRSGERQLAFGTDEDNFLGVDPESLQWDLGADPIAFARRRVDIGRDLLARQEARKLEPDQDYAVLRRSVSYALRDMSRAATILTRQIGGVRTLRDHAGTGRDPLQAVPAAEQRAALDLLASGFLSADSFHVSPDLQRKLAIDYEERADAAFSGEAMGSTDFSMATQVIDLQRTVLSQLLSDPVAGRLLDSEGRSPRDALRLSELYTRLDRTIWSELASGGDITPTRRELQREHVSRIAHLLLRPASLSRADARSLMRAQAQTLLGRIRTASNRGGLSIEARAHLKDSADTLAQALSAKLQRAGV
jgi:hypothetical protein